MCVHVANLPLAKDKRSPTFPLRALLLLTLTQAPASVCMSGTVGVSLVKCAKKCVACCAGCWETIFCAQRTRTLLVVDNSHSPRQPRDNGKGHSSKSGNGSSSDQVSEARNDAKKLARKLWNRCFNAPPSGSSSPTLSPDARLQDEALRQLQNTCMTFLAPHLRRCIDRDDSAAFSVEALRLNAFENNNADGKNRTTLMDWLRQSNSFNDWVFWCEKIVAIATDSTLRPRKRLRSDGDVPKLTADAVVVKAFVANVRQVLLKGRCATARKRRNFRKFGTAHTTRTK